MSATTTAPPEEADRLYGLPLGEFVGERRELAKRLRADGRREEAAAVAKLRKPTVAAWAANQVLRSQPADARELFAAGDALAAADRSSLREAIGRHREVLARLLAAAQGLLDENGRSLNPQMLERVHQTLNAVSLDPELRDEGRAARLTREQTYSGLGLRPRTGASADDDADERAATQARRREEEAARRRQRARLRAAQQRLDSATQDVRRARARLAELEAAEQRARDELAELE